MRMIRALLDVLLLFAIVLAAAGVSQAGGKPTDPKPIPASMVAPIYPEQERREGVQATVVLSVDVSADGAVTNAAVKEAVEGHPAFGKAAIVAVTQWKFEPARLDGKAVAITVAVPVKFALK